MLKGRAVRDAQLLRIAIEGMGTDDDQLRELVATRSQLELEQIAAVYTVKYNVTLQSDIRGDTSFNYRQALLACVDRADFLAARIHDAMEGVGTDDSRVIRILTSVPRSNRELRNVTYGYQDHYRLGLKDEIIKEISMPDLQDLKIAYMKKYGRPLAVDISKELSHNYKKLALELLKDPAESTADQLHEAMDGKGTNDDMLIEILSSRSNRLLQEASVVYQNKYGRDLITEIESETSGDYRKFLVCLTRPTTDQLAHTLEDAYGGLGTDNERVIGVFSDRSRWELRVSALCMRVLSVPVSVSVSA
jgi:Annexin